LKANREIIVEADPSFPASVTHIPPTREKVSFEPHTCLPNAFNLATEGKVAGQLTLGPGEFWRGSFRIRARSTANAG
jgi:galactose mutarotase-like enzyme